MFPKGYARGSVFAGIVAVRTALILAALMASAAALPVRAQAPPEQAVTGPLSACDLGVAQKLKFQGLNPGLVHSQPLSRPVIPAMGFAANDMSSSIDVAVGNYMNQYGLAGGTVAMSYNHHIIFAKSYGYVDLKVGNFTAPDSRFRLASVSKPITAMGALTMVHDGILNLDDHPFPFADVGPIIGGAAGHHHPDGKFNPELGKISIKDLLHHAGGWDRNVGPDYVGYAELQSLTQFLSAQKGHPVGPPDCRTVMSYVESRPLDFTPGTEVYYSNVGFCALSEVIREKGGGSFFGYLQAHVLNPLKMTDTSMGHTQLVKRQDRESIYYDPNPPDPPANSLFPPHALVAEPYSSIGAIEAQEGAGAIVSTAIDLARFAGAIAAAQLPNLPPVPGSPHVWPKDYYTISFTLPKYENPNGQWDQGHWPFGAGWDSVPGNAVEYPLVPYSDHNFIKDGGYPGTVSSVGVTADGYGFGAVFNSNYNVNGAPSPQSQIFWPGRPAGGNRCALSAAYDHAKKQAWNVDFSPQYSQPYSSWMSEPEFKAYLFDQRGRAIYPSRLEGRVLTDKTAEGGPPAVIQYRGRFASGAGGTAPNYLWGQSCANITEAVSTAPSKTPLVSLQRFWDPSSASYLYQAVWSAPITQLPTPPIIPPCRGTACN